MKETVKKIFVSRSDVGQAESEAVSRVLLEDGYLGMGREVQSFEAELAAFLGIPAWHVVCVNSGTAALHLAVAASTRPGDEVLVPSLTYVASFQACTAAGAVPVACEVHPETGLIDLQDASSWLTDRTRAIMPVHYAGYAGDFDAVLRFADVHGLRVIEDAAHAFGNLCEGRMIGTFGDITCFSFDGIKNITSGEGGALVTADEKVAGYVRDARLLGVQRDTDIRYSGGRSWDFDVVQQGYRYHMSNILAAIGRAQLGRFADEFAPKRRRLAHIYRERLSAVEGIILFETDPVSVVPHIQPIRVQGGLRDTLRGHLMDAGIETGIHYKPNHLLSRYGGGTRRLPVTERLYDELLTLPLYTTLNDDDIAHICTLVVRFMGEHRP